MKKKKKLNLYQKFVLVMIALGLFPMLILSTFILNSMLDSLRESLRANYEQAAIHISSSVENMLTVYDNASKLAYQYHSGTAGVGAGMINNYDNLRQVLTGENYEPDGLKEQRAQDMAQFLKNVESVDGYIYAAHFLARSQETGELSFHFSLRNTFFKDEERFAETVGYDQWDQTTKKLVLIPTHETDYFNGLNQTVFTVARNYFDLRGAIGQEKYVGTLFVDVDIQKMKLLFKRMHLDSAQDFYLVNDAGDCFFSTVETCIGQNLIQQEMMPQASEETLVITANGNDYGLKVIVAVDTKAAFGRIASLRTTMYVFLAACAAALLLASVFFSRKLTQPIHSMMEQMSRVESGDFDIELPVESQDEIGILSERFNHMSRELKNYINQSYVAQIRQNEAELTALKSQIYPHFLYNTLEIIRMTALDNGDEQVSRMIEALSEQIHYLIGPVQDMVPLEKEVEIIKKYIYLLNCRIAGKVTLSVSTPGSAQVFVPRLILQPIVENAYVHGIKPKNGKGTIMIETARTDDTFEISVMDNGAGMDAEALQRLNELLAGEEPGIKNEYNWQSIGLKNVHDRIRFLYGEAYGIRVTSTAGAGTIVQVLLPYQKIREYGEREAAQSVAGARAGGGEKHAENDSGG